MNTVRLVMATFMSVALLSPLASAEKMAKKAMSPERKACLKTCQDTWKTDADACKTQTDKKAKIECRKTAKTKAKTCKDACPK